jgi:hypothetical protein
MADIERQYEYKPRWSHVLLLGGFCTLLAASTIAHASPEDLGVLYWIVLVVSFAGVAWSGVLAVDRLFFRRRVAFTSTSLLLPKPWSLWQEEAIDYEAITGLDVSKVAEHGPRCLYLTHGGGRREIPEAMLPSRAAFEEVCALLTARVRVSACPRVRASARPCRRAPPNQALQQPAGARRLSRVHSSSSPRRC